MVGADCGDFAGVGRRAEGVSFVAVIRFAAVILSGVKNPCILLPSANA